MRYSRLEVICFQASELNGNRPKQSPKTAPNRPGGAEASAVLPASSVGGITLALTSHQEGHDRPEQAMFWAMFQAIPHDQLR